MSVIVELEMNYEDFTEDMITETNKYYFWSIHKKWFDDSGLKPSYVIREIGHSYSNHYQYLNGLRTPSLKVVQAYHRLLKKFKK